MEGGLLRASATQTRVVVGWFGLVVGIDEAMELIGVMLMSRVEIRVLDCFRMLGCDVHRQG